MGKPQTAELVKEVCAGNSKAFEALYNQTNRKAYFVALKISGNEDDAMDILQDSYVKALENINQLDEPENFVSWFNRIVANTAKNFLRKSKPVLFDTADDETAARDWVAEENAEYIPEEALDTGETRKAIMEIIDSLPVDRRLCVLMYYFDNLPTAQIAESLDVSEGTVKSHLYYSRKSIKERLTAPGGAVTLKGSAVIPFFIWLLERAAESQALTAEKSAALLASVSGATAALGAAATATAGTATAATATAATAATAAGKIAAAVTVPKIIAAATGAAIIAGGAATGAKIVKNKAEVAPPAQVQSSAVEHGETVTAAELFTTAFTSASQTYYYTYEQAGTAAQTAATAGAAGEPAATHEGPQRNSTAAPPRESAATAPRTTAGRTTGASTTAATEKAQTEHTAPPRPATTKAGTTAPSTTKALTTVHTTVHTTAPTTLPTTVPTTKAPVTPVELSYSVSGATATVTGCSGAGDAVVIPASYRGAAVTSVESYAFENNTSITSVSIAEGVQSIGTGAFSGCDNLASVTLPGSLTTLGITAFKNCPKLTRVTIPSGLGEIGAGAFQGCSGLVGATISGNTKVGTGAFASCPNLTICCSSGSPAQKYAERVGIDCQTTA